MAIFRCFWPYFGTWRSQFWIKNKIVLSIDFSRFRRLKWRIERPDWTSRKLRIVERKILYFLIFGVRLLASYDVNFEKILNRFSASENIFDEVSKSYPESQNLYRERVENPKRKIFYCKISKSLPINRLVGQKTPSKKKLLKMSFFGVFDPFPIFISKNKVR